MDINKGKQEEGVIQDKKVFLYKPYNISSEEILQKTPEPIFIQEEVNNLEKILKILQLPVKMILVYPLPHYKTL